MEQYNKITKISRFDTGFENLIETPFTEWRLRTGDVIPNNINHPNSFITLPTL